MLPAAYYWIDSADSSHLQYNYRGVANVYPHEVSINWQGKVITGRCASIEQGKRHVERWIAARPGAMPGSVRRRK